MKTKKSAKKQPVHLSEEMLYSDDTPATGDAWKKNELLLFEPKTLLLIIVTSIITLGISFFGDRGVSFLTSVISPVPAHAPFDGTVAPVKQVPNWVKLTESERKATFDQIPSTKLITFPTYNASRLALSTDGLKWNDPNDDQIRNEKITFAVPYLGSYRLDGIEGSGSHLAVDIKIPTGTPIVAIANGTVVKVDNGEGGFGHHIVIQHNNFPSFDNSAQKTTYYSSYSHMSTLQVKVNDVVVKGQQIGLSGATGTATTPHLHFQIDNDTVPWHPYWPFSSAEMSAAGYSFFDAINNGLGQDKARASTINPILYVQKYYQGSTVAQATTVSDATNTSVLSGGASTTTAVAAVAADPYDKTTFTILIPGGSTYEISNTVPFAIQSFDSTGKMLSMPSFSDSIIVTTQNNNGVVSQTTLTAKDFKTGMISGLSYATARIGKDRIVVSFRGKQFTSPEFEVTAKKQIVEKFSVSLPKYTFKADEPSVVTIDALDSRGALYPGVVDFGSNPVQLSVSPAIGTFSTTELKAEQFGGPSTLVNFTPTAQGIAVITVTYKGQQFSTPPFTVGDPTAVFTPPVTTPDATATDTPATDTTVTLPTDVATPTDTTENVTTPPAQLVVLPFTDIASDSRYFTALTALKSEGFIAGYADGTYHPENPVTRAEAITFILRVLSQEVKDEIHKIFPDVGDDQWFAKYVTTAFEMGFVKGYPDGTFKPGVTVNLAEFSTMLFVAARADIDPVISGELPNGVLATDWFAPYIQTAIRKGILVVENNTVDAARPLTRGDVAEILYRLRNIVNELKK